LLKLCSNEQKSIFYSLYLEYHWYFDVVINHVIVFVLASYPIIKRTVTDNCILEGQNVSLTCQVTYNGTNLMPLVMSWYTYPWYFGYYRNVYEGRGNTTNASYVHQSSLTFIANTTDIKYACRVSFSSPTGIVVPGVQKQSSYTYNSFWSSPFVSSTVASKTAVYVSIVDVVSIYTVSTFLTIS